MTAAADFLDAPPDAGAFLDSQDSGVGAWLADKGKRIAQSATAATGDVVGFLGHMDQEISKGMYRVGTALGVNEPLGDSDLVRHGSADAGAQTLGSASDFLGDAAAQIKPDPARDHDLSSTIASVAGQMVPVAAATLMGGIPGAAVASAGISSEETRKRSLAAGDTPELADAKAKVAMVPGGLMALVPGGSGYGSSFVGTIAKRAAIDAAVNAGADAATQEFTEGKVDWGQVGKSGAFGAGLGVVLGIPEALALRKQFGAAANNLEGKTLGEAVGQVAQQTGQAPTEIQRQINEATGVRPAGTSDYGEPVAEGSGPTPAESAVSQSAAEDALGPVAETQASRENTDEGESESYRTLFEASAARRKDVVEATADPARDDYANWWADQTGAETQTRQSPQGADQLNAQLQGEQVAAAQDARLADRQPYSGPPPVLEAGAPAADPRLVDPTPADPLGGRMPGNPEINVGQMGRVRPAWQMGDASAQGGFIDPKILVPIARSAMGGLLGYASGDTPEERAQRALLGMGFGALASPSLARWLVRQVQSMPIASDLADWAGSQFNALRQKLAPQSFLPPEIADQIHMGDQAVTAITRQGQSLSMDLQQSIRGLGDLVAQGQGARDAHAYLVGDIPLSQLPPPIQAPAAKIRNFVDDLSDRAVAQGAVQGTMAQTFMSNKGSYLRRSYDIFLDPNYKPEQPLIDAAVNAVAANNRMPIEDARVYVNDLLAKNSRQGLPDFLTGNGKIAGKDVGSLVRRQDLLPEIRTLFGEVKDPVLAANQTVPRLAKLIEMDATQKNVRQMGLQSGLFRDDAAMRQIPPDQVGQWVPVVGDASKPHDNFRGLYAKPEIAGAFQKVAGSGQLSGVPGMLWKAWETGVFAAKSAKTVFNPASYSANFLGHAMMNLANGNFRYDQAGHGLMLGAEELGLLRRFQANMPTRDALRAEIQQLGKLGVFHDSTVGEDLQRTLENSYWKRLSNPTVNAIKAPGEVYNQMFNFNRYVGYRSELARYSAAYPNKPLPELQRLAANVVSATTPTYSNVPQFVKQLSVAGLTPSFINFPFEVFRNTFNTARIGRADMAEGMRTGNGALVRNGARRLAALTLTLGAASGLGVAGLSRKQNNVDDQQDQAVRFFGAPWNREGSLQYHGPVQNGQATFSNLEYLLPHAIVTQAVDSAVRGAKEGQAAQSFLRALASRFTGDNILAGPLAGAITGMDPDTKRPIPRTAVDPTLGDRADYLWEKAFEPLIVPWVQKFSKAMQGQQGDYGQVYTVKDQLQQLVAMRSQSIDFNKAVDFKARDLGSQFNQATGLYRSKLKENLQPDDLAAAYQNSERARQGVFGQLQKMVQYAGATGVPQDAVIKAMRSAQIPSETILGVLDGKYAPGDREAKLTASEALQGIMARPAQERTAALARIYQQDPTLGKAVLAQVNQTAKGVGPYEQLLLSLGVADGARAKYIQQKLASMPDVTARQAWLTNLANKRILTQQVMAQLSQPRPGQN